MESGDGEYRAKCSTSRVARPPPPPVVVAAKGAAFRKAIRAAFMTAPLFARITKNCAGTTQDTKLGTRATSSHDPGTVCPGPCTCGPYLPTPDLPGAGSRSEPRPLGLTVGGGNFSRTSCSPPPQVSCGGGGVGYLWRGRGGAGLEAWEVVGVPPAFQWASSVPLFTRFRMPDKMSTAARETVTWQARAHRARKPNATRASLAVLSKTSRPAATNQKTVSVRDGVTLGGPEADKQLVVIPEGRVLLFPRIGRTRRWRRRSGSVMPALSGDWPEGCVVSCWEINSHSQTNKTSLGTTRQIS